MRFFNAILFFFLLLTSIRVAAASPHTDSYARFFAGLLLLKSTPDLSADQRGVYFKDLENACGLSADQAISFLRSYKDHPEDWQTVQNRILEYIDNPKIDTMTNKRPPLKN